MPWVVSTASSSSVDSSSMGVGTALSRALITIGSGHVLTSFRVTAQLGLGAGSGTYNTIPAGTVGLQSPWIVGLSWVPTGDSAPNLFSAPDDSHFLYTVYPVYEYDRQTINTAGSPAYKDMFTWSAKFQGRIQISTFGAGQLFWHMANISAATAVSNWDASMRATYV